MTDKTMTLEQAIPLVAGIIERHLKGVLVRDAWDAIARHLSQPAERGGAVEKAEMVRIVCDWANADPFPRFIEAETPDGKSISLPWHSRSDGLKEFHLYTAPLPAAGVPDAVSFAAYLIDNREGETVTEESLQCWLAEWLSATPSPTIDVAAVRDVIAEHRREASMLSHDSEWRDYLLEQADKLARAIGDAK